MKKFKRLCCFVLVIALSLLGHLSVLAEEMPVEAMIPESGQILESDADQQSDPDMVEQEESLIQEPEPELETDTLYDNADILKASNESQPQLTATIKNGTISVNYNYGSALSGKILFPVWTENGGQDDIYWYEGTSADHVLWSTQVNGRNHSYETGEYNIHAYLQDSNGNLVFLGGTSIYVSSFISGNMTVVNKDDNYGTFSVNIDNVQAPFEIKDIALPVWSEKNGQDDIHWYYANKDGNTWKVDIDSLNHKGDSGKYNIHLYYIGTQGEMLLVNAIETQVSLNAVDAGTLTAVQDPSGGKLSIIYSGRFSDNATRLFFPVWSEKNGQDDLHWYEAQKVNDVTWKFDADLRGHNYDTGKYNIHAYAQGADGSMKLIKDTQATVSDILSGSIRIVNKDMEKGTFTIQLENVKAPFDFNVKIPVWSEKNGQDDLIWYTAEKSGSTWSVDVDLASHYYLSGMYNIHLYYQDSSGSMYLIQGITENIQLSGGNAPRLAVLPNDKQTELQISLYGEEIRDVKEIRFAVWSEKNGQDDLTWYPVQKASTGIWKRTVYIKEQGGGTGIYQVHAYKVTSDGNLELLCGGSTVLAPITAASKIEITSLDEQAGQFRVKISDVYSPAGITDVSFAAWSEKNGQDDVQWYKAKKNGSEWYADIYASNHGNDSGIYNIHCYAGDSRGISELVGSTTKTVNVSTVTDGNLSSSVVASSWILYDLSNGRTLYSRNPDGVVQLASQTKIMTAMVVLDHVTDFDAVVTMTSTANSGMSWDTTRAGLVVGRGYTVRSLMEGLLVYSGGDCAGLLAEYVAGSKTAFVQLMNEKAEELGMSNTYFSDPVGLYDNHSTPREYMKLVKYADQQPVFRDITKMPSCVITDVQGISSRRLLNSNTLVSGSIPYDHSLYTVDGMKTGTTDSAGYCLTASAYNSSGRRIVAAVFRSSNYTQRSVDARTLLNYGFMTN